MSDKPMKCGTCGKGILYKTEVPYFAPLTTGYVIIEHVPCWKCNLCGEEFFSGSVMEKVDNFLDEAEKSTPLKVRILDYNG